MTVGSYDFVDLDRRRPRNFAEATGPAEPVLPVKNNGRLGDRRTVRLGSYLMHSANLLNLQWKTVSDRSPICEIVMGATGET
jgi:hypothetical protein